MIKTGPQQIRLVQPMSDHDADEVLGGRLGEEFERLTFLASAGTAGDDVIEPTVLFDDPVRQGDDLLSIEQIRDLHTRAAPCSANLVRHHACAFFPMAAHHHVCAALGKAERGDAAQP